MNKKGFMLLDALLSLVIVTLLCLLCFSIYRVIDNNEEVLDEYYLRNNEKYDALFGSLGDCIPCVSQEDTSTPEP